MSALLKNTSKRRATSRCRYLAINTRILFTCTSETAPCKGAIRRSSKSPRRRILKIASDSASVTPPVKICNSVSYDNAGTVEFLLDTEMSKFYFIEINPRIQVEHTVTETITGMDLVKRQILISKGHPLHSPEINIPSQESIRINCIAFQCRITTEDRFNKFTPDYGRIQNYRSAGGMGIRLDAGTALLRRPRYSVLRLPAGKGHGLWNLL